MQASRLLSIMMLLQTRGRMAAPALADKLEVSQRTILRDIDQLSAAGVPVWSQRGREAGFGLRPGWSTPLTGLTQQEANALSLAGIPSAATDLGLGTAAAAAQFKVIAALPAAMQADAQRVSARLHIDAIDWYRTAQTPVHLQAVANAVWHQHAICMRYESWEGAKDSRVQPLGLVLKAGIWYMAACPEDSKQARTYRVSNILKLTTGTDTFKRPKIFDLAAYWQAATERFESEIYHGTALVRASKRGLKAISSISAVHACAVARTAQPDTQNADWIQAEIPIESITHAASQLLGLGTQIEVLSPPALREQMRSAAADLLALYPHNTPA